MAQIIIEVGTEANKTRISKALMAACPPECCVESENCCEDSGMCCINSLKKHITQTVENVESSNIRREGDKEIDDAIDALTSLGL